MLRLTLGFAKLEFERNKRGGSPGDAGLFSQGAQSFGSLIYTAAKLKRMRRPDASANLSGSRCLGEKQRLVCEEKEEERGDYIVIREEC